jgi:hypothetical protein
MRQAAMVQKRADGACPPSASLLSVGEWGGVSARLVVKDPNVEAFVEFDCAHGTIQGPLQVGPDGSFKWRGTHIFEGGPQRDPPPPGSVKGAVYFGKVAGGQLSLQVLVENSTPSAAFTLFLGKQPFLHKCQ